MRCRNRRSDPLVAILIGVRNFVELGLAEIVVFPPQIEAPADDGALTRLIARYAGVNALVRVKVRIRVRVRYRWRLRRNGVPQA